MSFIEFTNSVEGKEGFWIDSEDEELISQSSWQWFTTNRGHTYAYSTRDGEAAVKAHRLILGLKRGDSSVDHINHDGLDNRKANLRLAGQSLNNGNRNAQRREDATSRFKGVGWDSKNCKWKVRIMKDAKEIWIGRFKNEEDAARAYDVAALSIFGEYALTNEMMGLYHG